jgi:hypothetical protein
VAVVVAVVVVLYIVGTLGTNSSSSSRTTAQHSRTRHRHHSVLHKTTTRTPPPPTKVTLKMVPTAPVYVCLVRGDGTRLIFEQTYAPGQTIPTETGSKLLLTLGNNSVQMKVNGRVWPLAPSPTAIRLLITPTAVQHISAAQQPTCP